MIKYVFIDIDDTIIDFQLSAESAIRKMFEEQNIPCPDDIMTHYRKGCDPLWRRLEKREITLAQLQEIRWSTVFENMGISYDSKIDYEQKYREQLSVTDFKIEGSDELLKYLSEKYTICAASNSHYFQQINRLKLCGFDKYITHLFTSNEIGYEKPYHVFFERCFEKLGNPSKDEVIMIGDSLTADVAGAYEFGIKSIWFNSKKSVWNNLKSDKPKEINADYTVSSLSEIKNIL